MKSLPRHASLVAALVAALGATQLLSACAPLIVGGAVVSGALMATDRRTSGTQIEDETIEFKASARLREQLLDKAHLNVNSYNRVALITGEVATEADRATAERLVAGIENVSRVLNESIVTIPSSISTRATDVALVGKVKAQLIDARDLISNAFYVVAERGTVFLMGRVTEREANRASEIARTVSGVNKVVRAFEIISEEELARITPKPAPAR
jgi:osmotically-inducible protein OsmY